MSSSAMASWALPASIPKRASEGRMPSVMLSRTDRPGTMPSALRSSGMSAMPAAIAARTDPDATGLPSMDTVPASSGCAP